MEPMNEINYRDREPLGLEEEHSFAVEAGLSYENVDLTITYTHLNFSLVLVFAAINLQSNIAIGKSIKLS